jgi:hypothetical protein
MCLPIFGFKDCSIGTLAETQNHLPIADKFVPVLNLKHHFADPLFLKTAVEMRVLNCSINCQKQ